LRNLWIFIQSRKHLFSKIFAQISESMALFPYPRKFVNQNFNLRQTSGNPWNFMSLKMCHPTAIRWHNFEDKNFRGFIFKTVYKNFNLRQISGKTWTFISSKICIPTVFPYSISAANPTWLLTSIRDLQYF